MPRPDAAYQRLKRSQRRNPLHEDNPCLNRQRSITLYVSILAAILLSKYINGLLLSVLDQAILTLTTLVQLLT